MSTMSHHDSAIWDILESPIWFLVAGLEDCRSVKVLSHFELPFAAVQTPQAISGVTENLFIGNWIKLQLESSQPHGV